MQVSRISLDLAKNVFQLHGMDVSGKTALRLKLQRSKVLEYFHDLRFARAEWKPVLDRITGHANSPGKGKRYA